MSTRIPAHDVETPLVEKLRSVPLHCKLRVASHWNTDGTLAGDKLIPVGYLLHEAAEEIERLQKNEGK